MSSESLFSTTFMELTKGYGFYHGNGIMRLIDGRKTILGGKRIGNQYVPFIRVRSPSIFIKVAQSIGLWHQRLGHVSNKAIRTMSKNNLTDGLEVMFTENNDCDSCHLGKQNQFASYPRKTRLSAWPTFQMSVMLG